MLLRSFLAFVVVAFVSGCVKPPKTADGFRDLAASGGMFATVETFEVDRPYQEVAETFQRRSDACLRVQVVSTSSGGYMSHPTTFTRDYWPRVKVSDDRAEFYVQIHIEGTNLIKVYEEADGGDYVMVADAYPVGPNKSRIELHQVTMGHDVLMKSVRDWATGESTACPDLTQ